MTNAQLFVVLASIWLAPQAGARMGAKTGIFFIALSVAAIAVETLRLVIL